MGIITHSLATETLFFPRNNLSAGLAVGRRSCTAGVTSHPARSAGYGKSVSDSSARFSQLTRPRLDRHSDERHREEWLPEIWELADTKVLRMDGGKAPIAEVRDADSSELRPELALTAAKGTLPENALYLGEIISGSTGESSDGSSSPGTHVVALRFDPESPQNSQTPENIHWQSMRQVGHVLSALHADLLTHAAALTAWHSAATFCPVCGGTTEVRGSGWSRVCTQCERTQFPRTDPAVITAVVDQQDRLLLGSAVAWDPRRFSTFAGFVEAGESLEDAIVREVQEEAGVTVESVEYIGSQAWPFPRSLMLGFLAHTSAVQATADEEEIREVRWFTRKSLHDDVVSGAVVLPPRSAVSHALITHWYGTALPDGPATSDPAPAGRAQSA